MKHIGINQEDSYSKKQEAEIKERTGTEMHPMTMSRRLAEMLLLPEQSADSMYSPSKTSVKVIKKQRKMLKFMGPDWVMVPTCISQLRG